VLDVRDLDVAYGAAPALWRASLSLREGELVCVLGPNGAGKTTLINALAGLHRARGGRIVMDGRDLTSLPAHRFCEAGIAIVPEGRRLFTRMSVRENLEIGSYARAARGARGRSLERVCTLFPAVRDKLGAPAGALSGGQQQMVAIGRALMSQPDLLLLDEPFLGVAPIVVDEVMAVLRQIAADGVTCLLVEQNIHRALDFATRAYVIENGRSVLDGTREQLLGDPEFSKKFLGLD